MAAVQLKITGMTCGHCQQRVEQALRAVKGVYGATVDLGAGSAEVDLDDRTPTSSLTEAVEHAGYGAEIAD